MVEIMLHIASLYASSHFKRFLGIVPIKPYAASVELTKNCNSRCITCDMWRTRNTNELTTGECENSMYQMRSLGIQVIRFSGGEPLLREDIGMLIKKAQELGFKKVAIQTNGLLLSDKAEKLVENGITDINVSIDGIDDTNSSIRGLPYAYNASIKGIKAVNQIIKEKTKKINMKISTTLIRKNIEEVPALLNVCRKLGVTWGINMLNQNPYQFRSVDMSSLHINDHELVDKTIDYLKKVKKKEPQLIDLDNNALEYVRAHIKGSAKEPPCMLAYITVYLGSQGDVYSGCWVLNPLGNVRKYTLNYILKSDKYRRWAQQMFLRKCPGCTCSYTANIQVHNLFSTLIERAKKVKNELPRAIPT